MGSWSIWTAAQIAFLFCVSVRSMLLLYAVSTKSYLILKVLWRVSSKRLHLKTPFLSSAIPRVFIPAHVQIAEIQTAYAAILSSAVFAVLREESQWFLLMKHSDFNLPLKEYAFWSNKEVIADLLPLCYSDFTARGYTSKRCPDVDLSPNATVLTLYNLLNLIIGKQGEIPLFSLLTKGQKMV